ncbi:hypothetical protein NC995_25600 [Leptolyngbya sp. FACHB-1515]
MGDRWLETTVNSTPRYAWTWMWSGLHWLSPEQHWNVSAFNQSADRIEYLDIGNRQIQALEFRSRTIHSVSQNDINHFRFVLSATTANNSKTQISEILTVGIESNLIADKNNNLSSVHNLEGALLEIACFAENSSGVFSGSVNFRYQFFRS